MRKLIIAALALLVAGLTPGGLAHADKDTTCEAYALRSMRQIEKSEQFPGCRKQGFFQGDRWRKSFSYHFDQCAQRYDAKTKAHQPFTQGEKKARDSALMSCRVQFF